MLHDKLLTKKDVQDLLHISQSTLNRHMKRGLKYSKKNNRVLFSEKQINEYLINYDKIKEQNNQNNYLKGKKILKRLNIEFEDRQYYFIIKSPTKREKYYYYFPKKNKWRSKKSDNMYSAKDIKEFIYKYLL